LKRKFVGNPFDSSWTNIAESLLPEVQKRQNGTSFRNGITGDQFIRLFFESRCNFTIFRGLHSSQSRHEAENSSVALSHDKIKTPQNSRHVTDRVPGKKLI
jgi:hypothetical protein